MAKITFENDAGQCWSVEFPESMIGSLNSAGLDALNESWHGLREGLVFSGYPKPEKSTTNPLNPEGDE